MTGEEREKDVEEKAEQDGTDAPGEGAPEVADAAGTAAGDDGERLDGEQVTDEGTEGTEEREGTDEDQQQQQLNKEDKEGKEEDESLLIKYQRLAADYQNFKRRSQEEKLSSYSNAISSFTEDILPAIDNFERALETKPETEEAKKIYDGMGMILGQLEDVLKKNGIEEIISEGQELDPNIHHAVQVVKDEKKEPGEIINVVQKGYKKGSKLIRPAMVVVAE